MEKTIQYIQEREAFGAPLSSYQLTQGTRKIRWLHRPMIVVTRIRDGMPSNGIFILVVMMYTEKLVRMTSTVACMYLLIERVTMDFDAGKCDIAAISMTKAHNTRMGRTVVGLCREILGGNGIVLDFGVASKFCDMEACHTYEGTYDINTLVAGRALTGIAAIKNSANMTTKTTKDVARSKL